MTALWRLLLVRGPRQQQRPKQEPQQQQQQQQQQQSEESSSSSSSNSSGNDIGNGSSSGSVNVNGNGVDDLEELEMPRLCKVLELLSSAVDQRLTRRNSLNAQQSGPSGSALAKYNRSLASRWRHARIGDALFSPSSS